MNAGSLFSGIGGFDLGLERAGFRVAWQCEIDPFCRRVLERHWPGVERWDDINTLSPGPVDVLVGGWPCQDLSVAGGRTGLSGRRSGLFWHIPRIAQEIKPAWALLENVPGLLSSSGRRDFRVVLAALGQQWPAVGYRILDSQHFGVPQRRRRVFLVCGPSAAGVSEVLALGEGSGGDSAAGGEAGASIARCLAGDTNAARYDGDTENFVVTPFDTTQVTSPLNYSQPRPGDPCHPLAAGAHPPAIAATLNSGGNSGGFRTAPGEHLVTSHAGSLVRRLTPTECERLQGFPDGWTCLCEGACACPDSPRYRALGNAVTVNVVEWLGRRLATVMA